MTKGKGVKIREKIFRNVVFVLFVGFLLLNLFKIPIFHSAGLSISKYFLSGRDIVFSPFSNLIGHFQSKESLLEENDNLKKEISVLNMQLLGSGIIENDYKNLLSLKQYENFDEEGSSDNERFAKVLLKPPYSSFDNLIITGNFDGVSEQSKVFYRNIILGEITSIEGDMATVKLYSASGQKTFAKLKSGEQIDVFGKSSGRYEATLSKDIEVKEGDPIIFPDKEIMILGAVNSVLESDDQLFNKILFNIPIDFKDIDFVELEKMGSGAVIKNLINSA